ncbi:unnamed protein product, partial [Callosobruchus maculatus]
MVLKPAVSIPDIKTKINGLRTTFLAEYRKYESSLRSGMSVEEIYKPSIWYFEKMYFILDHCQVRAAIDTIGESSATSMLTESMDDLGSAPATMDIEP